MKQFRDTYYYISEEGDVYSNYRGNMKKLKSGLNRNYYYMVNLRFNNKSNSCYIHRLVAECYLPDWDENLQVNHKDLNKLNNNVNNLEMVTIKENVHHYWKTEKGDDWEPGQIPQDYKERKRIKNKKYREKHKEKLLEKRKIYYQNNKEKWKQYSINHKEKIKNTTIG